MLRRAAALVREEKESLAQLLAEEIRKPVMLGRAEAERAAVTLDLAAGLVGLGQEEVGLGNDGRADDYSASVERVPRGVIFGIVPYNWPLNLTAHKVAPALASGNTIVVKPSPLAPRSTRAFVDIVRGAGVPDGVVSTWSGDHRLLVPHLRSPEVAMVSFTGSATVGWMLKRELAEKPVTLELGGDASVIVLDGADLEAAAERIAFGAFAYAGQICISVQHVWADASIHDELCERLLSVVARLGVGDPRDEHTVCGPLINSAAAERAEATIRTAGGERLTQWRREGDLVWPVMVRSADPESDLMKEEAFAPVTTFDSVGSAEEAIRRVNRSQYGIQAGIFGGDVNIMKRVATELQVGGVVLNDAPSVRFDALPYGGVKRSGFGREGVRWAMEEMTTPRSLLERKE